MLLIGISLSYLSNQIHGIMQVKLHLIESSELQYPGLRGNALRSQVSRFNPG